MYSLDVNFLKDRPGLVDQPQVTTGRSSSRSTMTPLIIGVAVGLLLPGIVAGLWLFLNQEIARLEGEDAQLQAELQRQNAERQKIAQLQKEIDQVNADTQSLASVFNQIKPWSAMLQDIRERVPPGVQIQNITQTQVAPTATPTPAPSPNAAANPQAPNAPSMAAQLEISGLARSFDDVNYFLLTLQRSPFLKNNETQLMSAELVRNPNRVQVNAAGNRTQQGATVTYELPKAVQYKIQTNVSDVPASELLRELDRKGAVGLVTRIRTLQEKGVIQP
jgi:type IV pilus assembly protein PilN